MLGKEGSVLAKDTKTEKEKKGEKWREVIYATKKEMKLRAQKYFSGFFGFHQSIYLHSSLLH